MSHGQTVLTRIFNLENKLHTPSCMTGMAGIFLRLIVTFLLVNPLTSASSFHSRWRAEVSYSRQGR